MSATRLIAPLARPAAQADRSGFVTTPLGNCTSSTRRSKGLWTHAVQLQPQSGAARDTSATKLAAAFVCATGERDCSYCLVQIVSLIPVECLTNVKKPLTTNEERWGARHQSLFPPSPYRARGSLALTMPRRRQPTPCCHADYKRHAVAPSHSNEHCHAQSYKWLISPKR